MVASGHRSKSNVPLQHAVNFAAALGERYCPSMYGADTHEGVTAAPSTSVSVIDEKSTTPLAYCAQSATEYVSRTMSTHVQLPMMAALV